jgi:hypothetical protein
MVSHPVAVPLPQILGIWGLLILLSERVGLFLHQDEDTRLVGREVWIESVCGTRDQLIELIRRL